MGSFLSKIRTLCDHETILGRDVLPHSFNVKATQQRRPTDAHAEVHGQEYFRTLKANCALEFFLGMAAQPPNIKAAGHRRPTWFLELFMVSYKKTAK